MANDIQIITGIICILVAVGVILPFVNSAFGQPSTSVNIDAVEHDALVQSQNGALSMWTVFKSVLLMSVWTFGALPWWLDLFFVVLRITLYLTVARNIWVGGGG
jgi:hypothetical protein